VPVVVSASVLLGAVRVLPRPAVAGHREPVDLRSAVLATGTMVVLVWALVDAAAYALLLRIDAGSPYLTGILPSMLLVGLAFTFGFGPLSIAATGVADREQGAAAGVISTPLVLALVGALALAAHRRSPAPARPSTRTGTPPTAQGESSWTSDSPAALRSSPVAARASASPSSAAWSPKGSRS
jgi:hypothetical protein